MPKRRSLGTKLTLMFMILGLGPLAFMGGLALWVITTTHRQDVATMETQLLNQKIEEIDKFIEEITGLFEIRVGYEETSIISEKDQQFLLEKLLEENKSIIEVSFIDLAGQETTKQSRIQDASRVTLSNISALAGFGKAKAGEKYFGPVYYTLNGPVMTVASPVFNRKNQVIMVLTGNISLAPLKGIIASARLGQNGYLYLVDPKGTIMASADSYLIYKNLVESTWIKELLRGIRHNGLDARDQRTGLLGIEVLSAGLPLEKLGWGIVAEWPRADAFSVVATIQRQVLLFSFITILAVAFLGWLVGRRILDPLATLSEGARKVGSGQFDYKIKIDTRDEIEELGEVFNRMGDDLKQLEELKAAEVRAEALAESLRKEKELSKMKDEFLTNASHQLRTPLSIANWNLELAVAAKNMEEEKTVLKDLGAGLSQLGAIVHDLITVSEFGPGFKNTLYQDVDIGATLKKVLSSRESSIKEKKIIWEENLETGTEKISANPLGVEIILENLIDNAITYTPAGGRIKAGAKVSAEGGSAAGGEGENIHLLFEDTGIGIPLKDQASIFSQAFRATNAINMKNVGTGLGLYIVKNIVEGHAGKIWFTSEEGKGTTFHITLPLKARA